MTQKDLNAACAKLGMDKLAAARVERGTLDFQFVHRTAFVKALRVPERWFLEKDVDVLLGLKPQTRLTADETRELLERLAADLSRVDLQGPSGSSATEDGPDPPLPGTEADAA